MTDDKWMQFATENFITRAVGQSIQEVTTLKREKADTPGWLKELLDLGMGPLAIGFLARLAQGQPEIKKCRYCDTEVKKFSMACPKCRNRLYL